MSTTPVAPSPTPGRSIPPAEADISAVDGLLAEARAVIGQRLAAGCLADAVADGALVVDIRPEGLRRRDGELPGATVIDRNVLEWRLDPTSPHRLAGFDDPDRPVVLVCDEGYASSLAAATLVGLGLRSVTDLDGGYQAWRALHDPGAAR